MSEGGTVQCCDESSESHLCFETLDNGAPLQILKYSCLPGRPVIAGTAYMCSTPKDCPPGLHCVRPVTPEGSTLLRIQRSRGNVVIFIGKPNHVRRTVQVSEYVQVFDIFPPEFAERLTRLMKYFVLFSSGLALINTIPCFYFDGNHITYALVNYLFRGRFRNNLIGLSIIIFGTLLLIINFSCLILKSLIKNF